MEFSEKSSIPREIEIMDASGKVVIQTSIASHINSTTVDLSFLANGVYYLNYPGLSDRIAIVIE